MSNNIFDIFKDMGSTIAGDKEVKTETISLSVKALTGSNPIINRSDPNTNVISFTKEQRIKLEKLFSKKPSKTTGKPSNVRIEHKNLWMPIVIKKGIPYIIGFGFVCYMAGRAKLIY